MDKGVITCRFKLSVSGQIVDNNGNNSSITTLVQTPAQNFCWIFVGLKSAAESINI